MITQSIDINKVFTEVLDFISVTNNIVQFFALIIGFFTALYFISIEYAKPILVTLGELGIKKRFILRLLLICRKDPRTLIRVFCEYSILESKGQHNGKAWWKENIQNFTSFIRESKNKSYVYTVQNCMDIIDEDTSAAIKKYFYCFDSKKVRKKYGLDSCSPINFYLNIKISEAFLTNNFLLSGLLNRYKNEWKHLIDKYIASSCNNFQSGESESPDLFFTFAWLLWGPSYQLKNQDGYYKMCQLAFGDENNSVNLVLRLAEEMSPLWNEISANMNGVLTEVTCKLYNSKEYIDCHRDKFSPFNTYFTNKLLNEGSGFVLEAAEYEIKRDYKAKNYYCTAYVWIMFEVILSDNDSFSPQQTLSFFEHANLASDKNYYFCIDALINKIIAYFESANHSSLKGKKYRFCLAMNSEIEKLLLKKMSEYKWKDEAIKDKIILNKVHSEETIFGALDSYFDDNDEAYQFIEVNYDNKESVRLLGEYYTSIYIQQFYDVNERESLDSLLDYLEKKNMGWYKKNNYHILLMTKNGRVIAGTVLDYFHKTNSAIIEFIAVKSEYQSEGVGTKVFEKSLEILSEDAKKSGKREIDYLFCEIDKPHNNEENAVPKHIRFWKNLGFKKIDLNYIQPALSPDKKAVDSLYLLVRPISSKLDNHNQIPKDKVAEVVYDYCKYAMRIDEPAKNEEYIKMTAQMSESEKMLKLTGIVERN